MAAIGTLPVLFATGNHAGRPAASAVGKGGLYACSTHSLIYQTDGSSWSTWATLTGTGLSDPMTTRGDIIVRNASNVTARLAIGSSGKVLQSDGTDISWQTPSGGGFATGATNVATDESTSSTSGTGLATAQTVVITVNTKVLVTTGADAYMSSGSAFVQTSFALSGANTAAFDEQRKWRSLTDTSGVQGSRTAYLSGLTPGSTTFTFQVYTSTGTAHFRYRTLIVQCLD